jgi:hypothetical protein
MIVEKQMECRLAGETEVLGENLPQRHFCLSQNPGLNPGRRGWKRILLTSQNGESSSCSATQSIPLLLSYPNIQVSRLLEPILSQKDPIHSLQRIHLF